MTSPSQEPLGPLHPSDAEAEKPLAATGLEPAEQLEVYRYLQLNRMVEDRLSNLYRRNKVIGGTYSSRGQEGVSVGSAWALEPGDLIGPLIRNLGAQLVRGITPLEAFSQYMARTTGIMRGKDNLPAGDLERGIIGPIAMLGALIPVMAGAALAGRMQGKDLVCLTWIGDGGTSTGDFHEGLNLAAVLDLPLVLIAENNGYAYSTPVSKQMKIRDISLRAAGYGIPGESIDGNDVLAVYEATRRAVERARAGGGPTLIEARTFRMKGHAEHDDAGYVPAELFELWRRRDPIDRFERHLTGGGLATGEELEAIRDEVEAQVEADMEKALEAPLPDPSEALDGVYEPAPPEVARR